MAKMDVMTYDLHKRDWTVSVAGKDWIRIVCAGRIIELVADENGFTIRTPQGPVAVDPIASNTVRLRGGIHA